MNNNGLPILISFSGGRTSAFMTKYLIERYPQQDKVVTFANTGKEKEETLEFVNECDKRWNFGVVWIEADVQEEKGTGTNFKIVTYETASRNGEPFEAVNKKYGLPNIMFPHCSRELKIIPQQKYMKSLGYSEFQTALGYRMDEIHRAKEKLEYVDFPYYPLVTEMKMTKQIIRAFWDRQEFDLKLKDYEGNCILCYKKSLRKNLTIIEENPNEVEWYREQERKYGKGEFTMFRNNRTVDDLVELSKRPFQRAKDEHETDKQQSKLFDYEMDMEYACFCKI